MKNRLFLLCFLFYTPVFAQSSGIPWRNGEVLTANKLQSLDAAKMNLNNLGRPGFAAKLDAQGRITAPVVGDISQAIATPDGQTVADVTAKADNAVQKTDANQQNGYAKLDGSGHVTVPVTGSVASAPANAAGDTVSSIADIAKSAASAATNAQATASGALQKADIGKAKSAAPTDSNAMMSAAVSGDSSRSPVTASGTSTARVLSDRFSDKLNIKDFGVLLNGNADDEENIAAAFTANSTQKVINIPSGTWPSQTWWPSNTGNTKFVNVDGLLNSPPSTAYTAYGINVGVYNFGSGVTSVTHGGEYFPNSVMTSRVSTGTTDTSYDPMVSHRQILDGPNNNHEGNNTEQNIAIVTPNSSGYSTNVSDKLYSLGHNYYGSFDVNHWSRTDVYGTNWVWDHIQELGESVTYFCNNSTTDATYCSAHYINEIDFGGYGADDSEAAYDPSKSTRTAYLLSTNTTAAQNTNRASWAAGTSFWKYQQIVVKDSSGKPWIFYALPTGYTVGGTSNSSNATSGTSTPSWTFNKGDTIVDGGLTWYCIGPFTYDVGTLIKVSGGNNPTTGYIERIGTLMEESNDYIYNAIFDMSVAKFDPNVTHVFARMQKDMYLDLTADGTSAGQNNALLGYNSADAALEYKRSGNVLFSIKDAGDVNIQRKISSLTGTFEVGSNAQLDDNLVVGGFAQLNGSMSVNGATYFLSQIELSRQTKAQILAISSPAEGMMVFNSDDHVTETYRCPSSGACGWYAPQYEASPLSN